jgi:2-dehydropantoate 2-reductase
MDGVLWNKLAILGPLALCTTAAALPLGALRVDTVWRQRLIDCSAEVRAVAAALGVAIERGWEGMLDSAPGDMRSSMQKDAAAGNPVELDAIAGPVLREGKTHGVLVPVTEELAGLVRERTATRS